MTALIASFSSLIIPLMLLVILAHAIFKKVKVLDVFIEGAEEGLRIVLRMAPYMIAMFAALASFRASGIIEFLASVFAGGLWRAGLTPEILALALLRPISGSGTMAITTEILKSAGPDSFLGLLASVIQGSNDTTFYVVAVYFGSIGITRPRHSLLSGLIGDITSVICAVILCNLLFARV